VSDAIHRSAATDALLTLSTWYVRPGREAQMFVRSAAARRSVRRAGPPSRALDPTLLGDLARAQRELPVDADEPHRPARSAQVFDGGAVGPFVDSPRALSGSEGRTSLRVLLKYSSVSWVHHEFANALRSRWRSWRSSWLTYA
jgi:hypothetical protein